MDRKPQISCAPLSWQTDMAEQNKQELRAFFKEKRTALPKETKEQWDRAIVERIQASSYFRRANAILLYAPMQGEIDLVPLVRAARRAGKRIGFPRCNTQSNTLQFFELLPGAKLTRGAYGIPEPPEDAPLLEADKHTLCLLPALTFSADGHRLGYGKGYYDRFLEHFPGVTLGAVYASFAVRTLPAEPHDRAVQYLVTERGFRICSRKTEEERPSASSPTEKLQDLWSRLSSRVIRFCKEDTPRAVQALPKEMQKTAHLPAILTLCIFFMLLLSHLAEPALSRESEYVAVILLQILIFLLPAILYAKLKGGPIAARLRFRPIRPEHLWFTACILAVMITGGLLCSILTGGIASLGGSFTLYSTFTAHFDGSVLEFLYAILAYALLPAVGEELIFRGILCGEYERYGVPVSVGMSALLFAMLHFSLPLFPAYLLLGSLLALTLYATRSILSVILLHVLYNVFCLFGQPYLSAFYVYAGSNEIFLFCLILLFLLFSAFALGEARKIYHVYAKQNADASYAPILDRKTVLPAFLCAGRSPALLGCVLLWLVLSLVNLLL